MSKKPSESSGSFLVQGSILAVASIVAKIIGMIYRVPLTNILGDTGNSYYSTANEIYTIILMVSTFSLPLAVSRMMSERIGRGEYRNANKVFLCAMRFAVLAGAVMALVTYALAGVVCKYVMNFELAKFGLRVIAPAILIFAITGTFRGYFQGFGSMVPTAVSQVIEQIINAIMSVVGAFLMFRYGRALVQAGGDKMLAPAWGAAGATFGTVASVTIALLVVMGMYTIQRKSFSKQLAMDNSSRRESSAQIYKVLIATIVPIIFSALIYNISTVLDQGIFNAVLKGQGYTEEQYATIWGIYTGKFRVLMNVVLSLASSLGAAIVPSMTNAVSRKNKSEARRRTDMAIRYTMVFSIPCAFGLAALGQPITIMLFHPTSGLPLTGGIMQAGTFLIIVYALSTVSTSILQGMGRLQDPVRHCTIALIVHIVLCYVLLKQFRLNIYAVIYANVAFALIICVLNAMAIRKYLGYHQEIYKTFLIPVISSVIMAFAAYGVQHILNMVLGVTLSTLIAIIIGAVLYGLCLVVFHGVTEEEICRLPKGGEIVKLFRKAGILR